jgi:hypothetical protein
VSSDRCLRWVAPIMSVGAGWHRLVHRVRRLSRLLHKPQPTPSLPPHIPRPRRRRTSYTRTTPCRCNSSHIDLVLSRFAFCGNLGSFDGPWPWSRCCWISERSASRFSQKSHGGNKETPAVLRVGRSQVDRDPLEVGARPCVRLSQSLTEHLLNCAFSGVFT